MKSKVTIGQGKAAFPPGGAEAAGRAEGTCRGRFLSSFPVPPSRPVPPPPLPAGLRSSLGASVPLPPAPRPAAALRESPPFPPSASSKGRAEWRRALPRPPVRLVRSAAPWRCPSPCCNV